MIPPAIFEPRLKPHETYLEVFGEAPANRDGQSTNLRQLDDVQLQQYDNLLQSTADIPC